MFLDKTKEKAHYHKGMMDAHLSKACELTTAIGNQMWAETDSEHSDSRWEQYSSMKESTTKSI